MIEKCANPRCESAFTYFRQGKLYLFDPRGQSTKSEWRSTKLEHYWLCGECATVMEIVADGSGIVVRRRMPPNAAA